MKTINKISSQQKILNFVMDQGGSLEFEKVLFRNSYGISKIRAVYFDEQYDLMQEDEVTNGWNLYVDRINNAIGIKNYCRWIRNNEQDVIGVFAFYNPNGHEIKMKHFDKWNQLFKEITKK